MNENLTIWEINGVKLELDITEADTAARYENALNALKNDIPAVEISELSASARIREICKAYRNLYDVLFGEGTSRKIFAGIPDSILKYNAVFEKFLAFVSKQANTRNQLAQLHEKYLPKIK